MASKITHTEFEELHRRGAEKFGWNWFKVNQWIVDAACDGGLEPEKNKFVLSMIAYKILVNFPSPAGKDKGE